MDNMASKFLEAMFIGYDNTVPKIKAGAKVLLGILFALLLAAILFISIGLSAGRNDLVTLGCLFKALVASAGLLVISPLFIALESAGKGRISGRGTIRFITSCFFLQLLIALFIFISPMSVGPHTFFTLNLAAFMLALTFAAQNPIARAIPGIVFTLAIVNLFFPYWGNKAATAIGILNEPRLLPIRPGDVRSGKIRFYVKGKPAVWYSQDRKGLYELWDAAGNHDQSSARLRPITDSIREMLEANEDLISPRNFIKENAPPPPPSNTGKSDSPPGSAAAAAAPDNSFDFSGRWNFRWERSPGYAQQLASDLIPARIDRMDSATKIVLLAPDGSDMANFEGTKTGVNSYSGRWNMVDNSGFGPFTINLQRPGFIEGTIMDEVAIDKRPAVIKFQKS
jgi:hypothetical protein